MGLRRVRSSLRAAENGGFGAKRMGTAGFAETAAEGFVVGIEEEDAGIELLTEVGEDLGELAQLTGPRGYR